MRTPRKLRIQCKALLGKRCRLTRTLRTRGGDVYKPGTRWLITSTWRGRFSIVGITPTGRKSMRRQDNGTWVIARHARGVDRFYFEVES